MSRRLSPLPLLVPILAIGLLWPAARADTDVTEEIFLGEIPKVLSATRLRQSLSETPAAVTVIDRQMIESSGALDIPDVLRLVPGFQVGHVNGQQTAVTYHGFSDAYPRRMQVLVDGRSVYNPFFGGITWADLPLAIDDIERIEVIRGPNGVAYGANAFSAVINIITRHPADTRGAFLKFTSGDIDTHAVLARYGGGDDAFRYRTTIGYHEDSGFPDTEDGKRVSLATFRGDAHLNERDQLDIQFGYNGGPRDEGRRTSTLDPPRSEDVVSHFQQLRWHRALHNGDELSLQVYHNYYRQSDTYRASLGPLQATISEDLATERFDLELQHTTRLATQTRLVWGAELRLDRVTGQGWFNTSEKLDYPLQRLFGNIEQGLGAAWIVNIGAMLEHNDVTGSDVSPRLGVNYSVAPGHMLRASYTQARRTPAAFEDRADATIVTDNNLVFRSHLGNSSLRPEKIVSYELGYLGEFSDLGLVSDLKVFREEIRDVIASGNDTTTNPADPFERFNNEGESNNNGAELQLTWRPGRDTRLVYAHSYSHQRGRILKQFSPATYIPTTEYTPVHTRSLFAEQRLFRSIYASLGYYRVSHMTFAGSANPTEYNTLDMRLAGKVRVGQLRGELAVVGQHLTGDYFDFDELIVFDKRFFVNLSLEIR